jgi:hypothetical protein
LTFPAKPYQKTVKSSNARGNSNQKSTEVRKEGDETTAFLVIKILEDVEEHPESFVKMLSEV